MPNKVQRLIELYADDGETGFLATWWNGKTHYVHFPFRDSFKATVRLPTDLLDDDLTESELYEMAAFQIGVAYELNDHILVNEVNP